MNVPWTEAEHTAKYGDSKFGASSIIFNFEYTGGNN
jgi:hypothetical protein